MDNIRNLSIIAHVDSGKSSCSDCLVNRAGLISDAETGTKRWTDNREDEKERGITIKSTGVSMKFEVDSKSYEINLVDTPGHCDFNSEVSSALRITDGALVIVDAVEGVCVQTETVLRQALAEQVKPILLINKLDRYIFELQLGPDEIYQRLEKIIMQINQLLQTYQDENSKLCLNVSPELGNVFFGSALHNWGFGLHNFAKLYASKFKVSEQSFMTKLWGENYYNPESKKITSESGSGERTFCKFILKPILDLVKAIMDNDGEKYTKMLTTLNVSLSKTDLEKPPKEIYKVAMRKFLPLADALLYGIVNHLPSPKQAQQYRVNTLYDGPLDDECANGIRNCDPNGPLMIFISKMIPMDDSGRFYAFGRIFSGTVTSGSKVKIMGTNGDVFENKSIQRVTRMIGGKAETYDSIACGNTVSLVGVDQYLVKSGTITNHPQAHPIRSMKFSVSPVVRVSVSPKSASDLPKLVEGLKKLSKSDPCVLTFIDDNGDHIIAGVGELHMEICLKDLRDFMKTDIKVGEPVVPLRETVLEKSSVICLSKSPNKHNRLYVTAEPLDGELVNEMAGNNFTGKDESNSRAKLLVNKYGWDPVDAKKIWAFGPQGAEETNLFVDITKGVQYLNEIRDHVNTGFQMVGNKGVLCDEPLRGVRFNLHDVTLHADAIHRGGAQMTPTARRVMCAAQLTSKPAIMEPIYLVEIQVPDNHVGTIYSALNHKRGTVISEEKHVGNLCIVKGHLPVMESFGFNGYIREITSGQGFPSMTFSHWQIMSGDPLDPSSKVGQIVRAVRKRKGLAEEINPLDYYLDRL